MERRSGFCHSYSSSVSWIPVSVCYSPRGPETLHPRPSSLSSESPHERLLLVPTWAASKWTFCLKVIWPHLFPAPLCTMRDVWLTCFTLHPCNACLQSIGSYFSGVRIHCIVPVEIPVPNFECRLKSRKTMNIQPPDFSTSSAGTPITTVHFDEV